MSDAKFCELGLMPAAGAEFQRKQSILLGKSPFPLVESTAERSKAGRTYAYAQVAWLTGLHQWATYC